MLNFVRDRLTRSHISNEEVLRGFIDNQGFLFSQPKSGTNLIVNTIAFYNAELANDDAMDFEDRYAWGIVHGGYITRDAKGIAEALQFHRRSNRMMITRFHDGVPGARPAVLIATTRGLLDQFTSYWNYKYRPADVSVDKAIPILVDTYAKRLHDQHATAAASGKSVFISYEDLMEDPHREISRALEAAYGEVDSDALTTAIRNSSPDEFKKWESRRGKPAISNKLAKFETSFIRSGKTGEGSSFFSEAQQARIAELAAAQGVGLSGNLLSTES